MYSFYLFLSVYGILENQNLGALGPLFKDFYIENLTTLAI